MEISADLTFAVLAFTSLLAIVDPLTGAAIFLALTPDATPRRRRTIAVRATATGFLVLVAFAAGGALILRLFGITTYAFMIAGGFIFFGIGSDMLQGRRSRVKPQDEEEAASGQREDVAIIPMGVPVLVGPGAIATVIALMGQATTTLRVAAVYAAIVAVMAICLLLLLVSPHVTDRLGPTGMKLVVRLGGLLVMVVGVQFILDGLEMAVLDFLKGL